MVYVRTDSGRFEQGQSLSTATAQEIEKFYDIRDDAVAGPEEFLRFNLKRLTALAASKDKESISWLSDFIQRFPDAPESRQLKALIAAQQ